MRKYDISSFSEENKRSMILLCCNLDSYDNAYDCVVEYEIMRKCNNKGENPLLNVFECIDSGAIYEWYTDLNDITDTKNDYLGIANILKLYVNNTPDNRKIITKLVKDYDNKKHAIYAVVNTPSGYRGTVFDEFINTNFYNNLCSLKMDVLKHIADTCDTEKNLIFYPLPNAMTVEKYDALLNKYKSCNYIELPRMTIYDKLVNGCKINKSAIEAYSEVAVDTHCNIKYTDKDLKFLYKIVCKLHKVYKYTYTQINDLLMKQPEMIYKLFRNIYSYNSGEFAIKAEQDDSVRYICHAIKYYSAEAINKSVVDYITINGKSIYPSIVHIERNDTMLAVLGRSDLLHTATNTTDAKLFVITMMPKQVVNLLPPNKKGIDTMVDIIMHHYDYHTGRLYNDITHNGISCIVGLLWERIESMIEEKQKYVFHY